MLTILLEEDAPDILVCLHHFSAREDILRAAIGKDPIVFQGNYISLFQDLSLLTLKRRRDFREVTDFLRNSTTPYRWGHPFRFIFDWNGCHCQLCALEEAKKLLELSEDNAISAADEPLPGASPA